MAAILVVIEIEHDAPWLIDAAAELASDMDARVHVVAVDDVESQRYSPLPRSELEQRARGQAESAARRLAQDEIESTWEVLAGQRTVDAVLDTARAVGADVIVVGGSPRRPVVQRVLGSLALELVRRADRPVLVVTPPAS